MGNLEDLEKQLQESPDNAELWLDFGVELGMAEQFKRARESFLKVLELDNQNALAHYNLGVLYSKIFFKDITKEELWEDLTDDEFAFELATKEFTESINLDPKFVPAYNDLGMLYKIKHIDDEAIRVFKKSLEVDPDQEDIKEELNELL